jgi:hypothetical protein
MRSSGRKTKQPRIFADRNRAKTKNGIHLRDTLLQTSAAGPPPQKGMVWVTDSGVYHKDGCRYYGKTKQGKYMTEADAQKAGYKRSKSASE